MNKYPCVKLNTVKEQKDLFMKLYDRGYKYSDFNVSVADAWKKYQSDGLSEGGNIHYPYMFVLRNDKSFSAKMDWRKNDGSIQTNSIRHFLEYVDKMSQNHD